MGSWHGLCRWLVLVLAFEPRGTRHGARGTRHEARGTGHEARGTGHGARGSRLPSRGIGILVGSRAWAVGDADIVDPALVKTTAAAERRQRPAPLP